MTIYCRYYYCYMYTYAVQMIKSGYLFNSLYNSSCVSFHIPSYMVDIDWCSSYDMKLRGFIDFDETYKIMRNIHTFLTDLFCTSSRM